MIVRTITWLLALMLLAVSARGQTTIATSTLILELHTKLRTLEQQLARLQAGQPPDATPCTFSRNLYRGVSGQDVQCLQRYLNASGFAVDTSGVGAPGNESIFFGSLTKGAVARWQARHGVAPAAGYFGSKSRNAYQALLLASAAPSAPQASQGAAPPAPAPPPLAPPPPPQATTTPTATPVPTPTPTPTVLPTPGQLGLPIVSFSGWGSNYLKVQFTHDPGTFTRSYVITIRAPNQTRDTRFGPYALLNLPAATTTPGAVSFLALGQTGWEWRRYVELASEPEGIYQVALIAVGEGGVEGAPSPGRLATLYAAAEFDALLEGTAPQQAVQNFAWSRWPLTIRVKNSYFDLRYRYTLSDGPTSIWQSGLITQSIAAKIEATFSNVNNYLFVAGASYRLRVESFDNSTAQDSEIKQKSGEVALTFAGP